MSAGATTARWGMGIAALALVGVLLFVLRGVLTPVLFAFLLAYMLDPLADRFEAAGLPRTVGIVALLGAALLGLSLFALLVVPAVVRDAVELARELPEAARKLLSVVGPWLAERGIELPASGDEILAGFDANLKQIAPGALASAKRLLGALLGGTASALGAVAGALMVPILSFYLLQDFDDIVAAVRELIPPGVREPVVQMTREVDEVIGQFMRGQLTVMAILSVLYASAYALVGVRLAVPIGIAAGMLSFIPYVGGAVALGLALVMVALHFVGWGQVLAVVAAYGVIQILEGFVITPRIVGDKLGLAPVWVLFALMVGGELFGFLGVMLALPAAAVVKVFVLRALVRYRESVLFAPPPPEEPAPVVAPPRPPRLRLRRVPPARRRRRVAP